MKKILTYIAVACLALGTFTLTAQRQNPPEGGKPKDFVLPARTTFTLDNGLKATLVQFGDIPKVAITAAVRAGRINETSEEVWLSDLVGEMMKEGTSTRSSQQLARDAARLGGSITVTVGNDRTVVNGDALAEFSPELIGLLADVLRHPAFPESELPRVKAGMQRNISVLRSRPDQLASEKFRNVIYGDHPYGRPIPREAMIASYTVEGVRAFHAANFGAANTHIVVVGKFDAGRVEQAIRKEFGDWAKGNPPLINIPKPVSRRAVYLIDRPAAPQSTIVLGKPVIDPSKPDYLSLVVTNSLLGGSFDSRITGNIRENKGYTYSPYSTISSRYRDAYWAEMADYYRSLTFRNPILPHTAVSGFIFTNLDEGEKVVQVDLVADGVADRIRLAQQSWRCVDQPAHQQQPDCQKDDVFPGQAEALQTIHPTHGCIIYEDDPARCVRAWFRHFNAKSAKKGQSCAKFL